MRSMLRFSALVLFVLAATCATPAFAANKDMIQLQTQVQELQDAIARLQQSNDERMGVMKDLVQQTADSVNKMSLVVATLQQQMQTQQEAQNTKLEQVSGQMQSLNDSLDELKARLTSIDKSIQAIQSQQQSISGTIQNNAPPVTTAPGAGGAASAQPAGQMAQSASDNPAPIPAPAAMDAPAGKPSAAVPSSAAAASVDATTNPLAPPVEDLYKTALGDYMGARYALATAEFSDVVKFYPDNTLAGNADYYLGEIEYRASKYALAVRSYDKVIEQHPGNNKIAPAELHKGQALFALKQNDAGVRELRALIQRYPNSPEAMQARSRLSGMGVPVVPRHN